MNHNHFEAIQTVQKLAYLVGKDDLEHVDVSIHPPFTDIRSVQTVIDADKLLFAVGAQNCHWEDKGAFTGEVSPVFLVEAQRAVRDRRPQRASSAVRRDRRGRRQEGGRGSAALDDADRVRRRDAGGAGGGGDRGEGPRPGPRRASHGLKADKVAALVVAYEPIWAIGTGRTATSEDAQQVCAAIRGCIREIFGCRRRRVGPRSSTAAA